ALHPAAVGDRHVRGEVLVVALLVVPDVAAALVLLERVPQARVQRAEVLAAAHRRAVAADDLAVVVDQDDERRDRALERARAFRGAHDPLAERRRGLAAGGLRPLVDDVERRLLARFPREEAFDAQPIELEARGGPLRVVLRARAELRRVARSGVERASYDH